MGGPLGGALTTSVEPTTRLDTVKILNMRGWNQGMFSFRVHLMLLLLLGVLWITVPTEVALAQVTTVETLAPEVDSTGRTAGERIDQIVVTLRIVGVALVVATGFYWWRTRPRSMKQPGGRDVESEGEKAFS